MGDVDGTGDGGGYGAALARVHDEGFGHHARAAAGVMLRALGAAGHPGGLVVDLGCGTGILAEALTGAGHDVLGVDRSPAMLAEARRRAPRARLLQASFVDVALPPCAGIACIGEVLGYAFDPRAGRDALRGFLGRARAALDPAGVLLFDVAGPGRGPARGVRRTLHERPGWTLVLETTEDATAGTLTRRQILFVRQGDGRYARHDETHVLRLMDPRDVLDDLAAAGFRARVLRRYGDLRFPRGLAGFAARPA